MFKILKFNISLLRKLFCHGYLCQKMLKAKLKCQLYLSETGADNAEFGLFAACAFMLKSDNFSKIFAEKVWWLSSTFVCFFLKLFH